MNKLIYALALIIPLTAQEAEDDPFHDSVGKIIAGTAHSRSRPDSGPRMCPRRWLWSAARNRPNVRR